MPNRGFPVLVAFPGVVLTSCATPPERVGQRLFAGCVDAVDDAATLRSGRFVCEGKREPEPFGGNGRSCGDCHVPGDRVRNLCAFSVQAVSNHMSKTVLRRPGVDFRVLAGDECQALVAYMLSELVAGQASAGD